MAFLVWSRAATAFRVVATRRAPSSMAHGLRSLPDHLQEAKNLLENDAAILLDVREKDEWDGGHFAKAQLVPYLSQLQNGDIPNELKDTSQKIFIHCKAGGRALKSAEFLRSVGLDAVAFPEGFEALKELEFGEIEQ